MNQDQVRDYLLAKIQTFEYFPFGPEVAVFKVVSKMFATLVLGHVREDLPDGDQYYWLNLKCDPQEAHILRDIFPAVIPGYHMNKAHWNTVILNGTVPEGEIQRMIDNSYDLVVASLPKYKRPKGPEHCKH